MANIAQEYKNLTHTEEDSLSILVSYCNERYSFPNTVSKLKMYILKAWTSSQRKYNLKILIHGIQHSWGPTPILESSHSRFQPGMLKCAMSSNHWLALWSINMFYKIDLGTLQLI